MNDYRCASCYTHFRRHSCNWPNNKDSKRVHVSGTAAEKKKGCANPSHNKIWDLHAQACLDHRVGGIRCQSCHNWINKHSKDYPLNKNGVDTTTHVQTCNNPGHESFWLGKAYFNKEVNDWRCKRCVAWYNKERNNYPTLSTGQIMRMVCQNPGHPTGTDETLNVTAVNGTLRCSGCHWWFKKYGVERPAKS